MNPCNEHEAQDVRESGAGFDCKVCEIKRLTASNEKLEVVYEAAGEYLYDTNKRQGLQDAYLAVQTTEQECDHLTNGKMYIICKKCGVRTDGNGRRYPDGTTTFECKTTVGV